jgi:hypothetical protein
MCNFHVGQKVVCVDASDGEWNDIRGGATGYLVEGEVYTVASIRKEPEVTFLRLEGVFSGWASIRFRPVVERKTDISIFRAMLNPSKQLMDA